MGVDGDKRPDDSSPGARPQKTQVASIVPDVNPLSGDATASYRKVLARHMSLMKKTAGRRVEWDNNLGIVKFSTDTAGKVTATQQLWYWLPDDELDDDPDAYQAVTDTLEPTTDSPPLIA
jgi:hypothetical protein